MHKYKGKYYLSIRPVVPTVSQEKLQNNTAYSPVKQNS